MDIYQIRAKRLRELIECEFGGNQARFAREKGFKTPQINRWLSTTAKDKRNITEESARSLEEKSGKPEGWLDRHEEAESSAEDEFILDAFRAMDEAQRKATLEYFRALSKLRK